MLGLGSTGACAQSVSRVLPQSSRPLPRARAPFLGGHPNERRRAHPFRADPAAALVKAASARARARSPLAPCGGSATEMRRADAVQSTLSKTSTRASRGCRSGAFVAFRRVQRFHGASPTLISSLRALGRRSLPYRASSARPLAARRPPSRTRPIFGIARGDEPRSLRLAARERCELPRSGPPSIDQGSEDPLLAATATCRGSSRSTPFHPPGLPLRGASPTRSPQPRPRRARRARRRLPTSATDAKHGHTRERSKPGVRRAFPRRLALEGQPGVKHRLEAGRRLEGACSPVDGVRAGVRRKDARGPLVCHRTPRVTKRLKPRALELPWIRAPRRG